jgi:hypothetical protein
MACQNCDSGNGFGARYCDDCERWTIHAEKRHVFIGAAILLVATIVVVISIIQPELIPPIMGGAFALARRVVNRTA